MKTLSTALALFAVLLVAGCGGPKEETAAGSPDRKSATTEEQLKFAFVTNNASDFWTIARKGVEKADAELDNVTVEFVMPGDGTAAQQKRLVDDLLAKGVDGIAISPVDPTNQIEMLNMAAKQALVVTQDSDAPDSDRACYVGTDNLAAGRMAGEELKKALPNGGKVMIFVGSADAQNAKERIGGLKEAIAGTKIEVLDVRTDETDRARIEAVARTLLFGFADDVIVRIYSDPSGSRIDLRSSSRWGDHDLGANARRIRDFFTELDAAVVEAYGQ